MRSILAGVTFGEDPPVRRLALVPDGRPRAGSPKRPADQPRRLSDELDGYFRMRRRLEPALAAKSCRSLRPADLDRLELCIPLFTGRRARSEVAIREFETNLLRPAATPWDLRVLSPTWDDGATLARAVLEDDRSARALGQFRLACHELISAYRTRNPVLVRGETLRYLDRAERLTRRVVAAVG